MYFKSKKLPAPRHADRTPFGIYLPLGRVPHIRRPPTAGCGKLYGAGGQTAKKGRAAADILP